MRREDPFVGIALQYARGAQTRIPARRRTAVRAVAYSLKSMCLMNTILPLSFLTML